MSQRFHVLLTTRQHVLLNDEASRTGLPVAELIRRAVDKTYRPHIRPTVRGIEVSVGLWRRPDAAIAGRRRKRWTSGARPTLRRARACRRCRRRS